MSPRESDWTSLTLQGIWVNIIQSHAWRSVKEIFLWWQIILKRWTHLDLQQMNKVFIHHLLHVQEDLALQRSLALPVNKEENDYSFCWLITLKSLCIDVSWFFIILKNVSKHSYLFTLDTWHTVHTWKTTMSLAERFNLIIHSFIRKAVGVWPKKYSLVSKILLLWTISKWNLLRNDVLYFFI